MLSLHQQDFDDNQTDPLQSPPSSITTHPSKSAHPLDLPEIRTRIGHFLSSKGLACCARVSREWHASFHPLLWADVHIPDSCTSPTVPTLQKYAPLIKSLGAVACRSNSTYFTLKGCINLSQLYIRTRSRFWSMSAMAEVPEMIQEHSSSLQELELDAYEFEPSTLMWEAIGRCSRLQTLKLHNIKVSPENLQPFLLACTRVSVLHLLNPTLPDETLPYTSGPELKGVQDLRLHEIHNAEPERQLLFMKLCSNITSLYWRRSGFTITFPIRQVTSGLAAGAWPNLHSLELFGDIMEDEDLAGLIRFMPRLVSWRTTKTGFGPVALAAMERHFLTIREIDLRACESLTSPMIQYLLCSIPTLEYFSADRLCADDILQDPVWPCSPRLKTLKLFIDMGVSKDITSDEFKAQQMAVFDRLSMLRVLTVLQVSRNVAGPLKNPALRALRLQLSAGMTRLDKLHQLEELWFYPGQVMEEEDVEWILKSFPRLRAMSFYMHGNYDKNEQLLKSMKAWGKSEVVRPKLLSSSSDRSKA
ncbi:hypothetical protein BGZ89_006722 [Linnemannia elongata]|nr:hypothetical protein BGZ89_006722 [Linnemannia elongata]